jgi:hypothetical protein
MSVRRSQSAVRLAAPDRCSCRQRCLTAIGSLLLRERQDDRELRVVPRDCRAASTGVVLAVPCAAQNADMRSRREREADVRAVLDGHGHASSNGPRVAEPDLKLAAAAV